MTSPTARALLMATDQHSQRMAELERHEALIRELVDILDVPMAPPGTNGMYHAEDLLRRAREAREAEFRSDHLRRMNDGLEYDRAIKRWERGEGRHPDD